MSVPSLLADAESMQNREQYMEAIDVYDQLIGLDPANHTLYLNHKGLCFKQSGDNTKAMICFDEAIRINPSDWLAYDNKGLIFKDTGLYQEAVAAYEKAIAHGPNQAEPVEHMAIALTDMGTQFKLAGSVERAISSYREALRHNTQYAPAYFNLGVVYSETQNYNEALKYYKNAIKYNANYVEAYCNIGVIYKSQGDLEQALEFYSKAVSINPNFLIANNNIAIAQTDLGTKVKCTGGLDQGIDHYKKALFYNSKYPPAWYNLGVAYAEKDQFEWAVVCYEMAVAFNPKCAEAYNNLGVIYKDRLGNLDKAIQYYEEALKANPVFAQTLNNLGVIYTMLGKLDEAYDYCNKAIEANKNYAEAYNNLGVLYRDEGLIAEAIRNYDMCLQISPDSRNAGQNRLLAMNSLPEACVDASVVDHISQAHLDWGRHFASSFKPFGSWPNSLEVGRPLRIGYLSADFFTHSVSYFIEAPLRDANPKRQTVICYSSVIRKDDKTEHLQKLAKEWRHIYSKSAQEVAQMIREDQIDILVELTGHTAGNRLDVAALKPAPVSVTWIGYPNSSGLPTIDYRFTDDLCDPPHSTQKYSEKLRKLPGCFLCYTPTSDPPPVAPSPAAKNGFITFGSFNNLAKVNDRVMRVWCSVLQQVPNSRIFLKCKPFACESVRKKYLKKFEEFGIDSRRVELTSLTPTTREHLETYSVVDVSVDTFPYAGTTTTCESLFMGVPVITLASPHNVQFHAHNVGYSLLSRIPGCERLIARTEEEYVRAAVDLVQDVDKLAEFRASLRLRMMRSDLCDGRKFVAGLEDLYDDIWRNYVASATGGSSHSMHEQNSVSGPSSAQTTSSKSPRKKKTKPRPDH